MEVSSKGGKLWCIAIITEVEGEEEGEVGKTAVGGLYL